MHVAADEEGGPQEVCAGRRARVLDEDSTSAGHAASEPIPPAHLLSPRRSPPSQRPGDAERVGTPSATLRRRSHRPGRSVWIDPVTGAGSTFHVDLRGVVDLLSHHLYSSPRVYLRELLQNTVDAITERSEEDAGAPRRVRVVPADVSAPDGRLHVEDTGVGLDEDGIRAVLATIRASTKRDALGWPGKASSASSASACCRASSYTDEITVTTRRAGGERTWQWVGRDDGTYAVSAAPRQRDEPGTDVALRPRGSAAELLSADVVERLAATYAAYLPSTSWWRRRPGRSPCRPALPVGGR